MDRKESNALLKAKIVSLDDLMFEVEQQELDEHRSILTEHDFGGQYASAIYSPDLNRVLHLAGRQYQLISNREFIQPIYNKLLDMFGYGGFTVRCKNEDDRRFSAEFILTDKSIEVASKDFVNAMIEVQNSYDGSLRHSIGLSYWRQICSNGLMGYKKETLNESKHISDYLPSLEFVLSKLETLDKQMQGFEKLTDRRLTPKEVERVMGKFEKIRDGFPKRILPEVPLKMYEEAEKLETKPTAWLLYNAFNFHLNHDSRIGLSMDNKERVDRQVISVIEQELALN
jgi:hypothetical protein